MSDPDGPRGRMLFAVLGAMAAVGLLCVVGGAWLLGWWRL